MAAPITHIVISDVLKQSCLSTYSNNWKSFILGTSFPDIRYLGVIDRAKTHLPVTSLKDVTQERSAFSAGMKFHNLVDLKREEFVVTKDLYRFLPNDHLLHSSVKFYEDSILVKKFNRGSYVSIFDSIDLSDLNLDVSKIDIDRWYSLVRDYISISPERYLESLQLFVSTVVPEEKVATYLSGLARNFSIMKENKKFERYVDELIGEADSIFS